jgi:hypothetical protein
MSKVDIYRYVTAIKDTDPTGEVTPDGVISPVEVIPVTGGSRYAGIVPAYVDGRLVPLIAWLVQYEGFDPGDVASVMDELVFIESREV